MTYQYTSIKKTNFISNASVNIARSGIELSRKLCSQEYSTDVHIPKGLLRTSRGLPIYGVIDKLSVVGNLPIMERSLLTTRLDSLKSTSKVSVERYSSEKKLYRAVCIVRSKQNHKRYFRFDYGPKFLRMGCFRLELSPQHFGSEAMDIAVTWLEKRLGEPFVKFLYEAWVTRIDYAIDMWGWKLDDFWVRLNGSRLLTVTSIKESTPTKASYRHSDVRAYDGIDEDRVGHILGSARSDIEVSVYDKPMTHSEIMAALELKYEFCSTVGPTNLSKVTDCTRIEVRYRPSGGTYLLRDIHKAPDILSKVAVYPRYRVREVLPQALYDMIGTRTVFEMIASLPGNGKEARNLKNKVLRLLKKCESSDFFDKAEIMAAWPQCVFQLGRLADAGQLTAEQARVLKKIEKKLNRRLSAFSGGPGMPYDDYLS